MTRIGIVLYDGVDLLDAVGPWEVFRKAERAGAPVRTTFLASRRNGPVMTSDGLPLTVFEPLEGAEVDWLLVPGGSWLSRDPVGAWGEIQKGELPKLLAARRAGGTRMASVCTGAMILSAAGITAGREVTTHSVARAALRAEGGWVVDARVVDDGDLVSSAGVTACIDLALWLVERLASAEAADKARRLLEWDNEPNVHRGRRFGNA
jgi:transcriptional regulator GlxA family with amidase domain